MVVEESSLEAQGQCQLEGLSIPAVRLEVAVPISGMIRVHNSSGSISMVGMSTVSNDTSGPQQGLVSVRANHLL